MENEINKTELRLLRSIVPQRLYLKFEKYGITSIESAANLSSDEFASFRGVGATLLKMFEEFKELISRQPELTKALCVKNVPLPIREDISNLELKYLVPVVPRILNKKFRRLKAFTVAEAIAIDRETFASSQSVGSISLKHLDSFIEAVQTKPDLILSLYKENSEKVLPFQSDEDTCDNVLDCLIRIVKDYFSLNKKTYERDILFKRFGINEDKKYTLEEIGMFYNKTRERIRQLQNEHLQRLKKLLRGESLKKPKCRCSKDTITKISKFENQLRTHAFLTQSGLDDALRKNSIDVDGHYLNYLSLLLAIFEIDRIELKGDVFYVIDKELKKADLSEVHNIVFEVLERQVIPISLFDLIVSIKKILNRGSLTNSLIEQVCLMMQDVQMIKTGSDVKFQIKFEKLSTTSDLAHRILFENQEPMHYNAICREINHRWAKAGVSKRVNMDSLRTQMLIDKNLASISKTGYWTIKSWKENRKTLLNLIVDALHFYNRPCHISEIVEHVLQTRSNIRKASLYSILYLNKHLFLKTPENKVILRDWKDSYKEHRVYETKNNPDRRLFIKALIESFNI